MVKGSLGDGGKEKIKYTNRILGDSDRRRKKLRKLKPGKQILCLGSFAFTHQPDIYQALILNCTRAGKVVSDGDSALGQRKVTGRMVMGQMVTGRLPRLGQR